MSVPLRWIVAGSAAFVVAAALVAAGATRGIDLALTRALQTVASLPLDLIANADTLLGQTTITSAAAILLALLLWRRERGLVWIAPLILFGTIAAETVMKLLLVHPPPPHEFVRASGNPLGVRVGTPSSFPSGHATRATFFAFLLWDLVPGRAWRAALIALVAVTLWARVYLGDHWVSDVAGGAALGTVAGALALGWIRAARAAR